MARPQGTRVRISCLIRTTRFYRERLQPHAPSMWQIRYGAFGARKQIGYEAARGARTPSR